MKIGIFGHYCNDNYGGQLTVLSTYSLIKNLGYDPLVFRFKNHNFDQNQLFNIVCEFTKADIDTPINLDFWSSYFDAFILCSDWTLFKNWVRPDRIRLFEWVKPGKTKIAISSSFGTTNGNYSEDDYLQLGKALNDFKFLGIREDEGVELCHKLGAKHAFKLPDPIFGHDEGFYTELANCFQHKPKAYDYAAIYLLDLNQSDIDIALETCEKLNLKPLFIVALKDIAHLIRIDTPLVYDVTHGVSSWLYYLKNSSYIITNSFHGLCLALIFDKDFVCIPRSIYGGIREKNLLNGIELMDKIISDADSIQKAIDVKITKEISASIKERLSGYKQILIDYLKDALKSSAPKEDEPDNNKNIAACTVAVLPREDCTGCLACGGICPKNCISASYDPLTGFVHSSVSLDNCIKCGLCQNVCPILSPKKIEATQPPKVFAGYSLNESVRFFSTSGGFFYELAKFFIEKHNAVIFGAIYETPEKIIHSHVSTLEGLKYLMQSKYVQSDLSQSFIEIKNFIEAGKFVVFCGTPCQCAAIANFLDCSKVERNKLFLIDFICHSVNSPAAYRAYLAEIADSFQDTIKSVWFKNKEISWQRFSTRIDFMNTDKCYSGDRENDPFYRGFLNYNLYARESCTRCKFKGESRNTDLTLADAWGIKFSQDTSHGVSLAILQSEKGREAFYAILDKLYYEDTSISDVKNGNPHILYSTVPGKYKDFFWENLAKKVPFSKIINEIGEMQAKNATPAPQAKSPDPKPAPKPEPNNFVIPENVILNGAILRAHPEAAIIVKNGCFLNLNHDKYLGSHSDCLINLAEGSRLIVEGNFSIYHSCRIHLHKGAVLRLGNGYLNTNGIIVCQKSIDIGDAIIAPDAYIVDSDYHALLINQKVINPSAPVKFEGHVWLGQNVTVLKGVTIGYGSVIGAKSLVNKNIPARSLAVGNPAKVIKSNIEWS